MPSENEISDQFDLIDLLVIPFRNWKVLLLVFTITLLTSAFFFLANRVEKYDLSTLIQIGTIENTDRNGAPVTSFIENGESVVTKLINGYIPRVVQEFEKEHPDLRGAFKIDVVLPQKTDGLVQLKSSSVKPNIDTYLDLHRKVLDSLITEHALISSNSRRMREVEIESMKVQAIELQRQVSLTRQKFAEIDQKKMHVSRSFELLEKRKELIESESNELQKRLDTSEVSKSRVVGEAQSQDSKAMIFLLLDQQLENTAKRLSGLREELSFKLEEDRMGLEKESTDIEDTRLDLGRNLEVLQNKLKVQNDLIASAEFTLSNRKDTRSVYGPAVLYSAPASFSNLLILFSCAVLAFILGIMSTFIWEGVRTARGRIAATYRRLHLERSFQG